MSGNNKFYSDEEASQYFGCIANFFESMYIVNNTNSDPYYGVTNSGDFTIPYHKVRPNDSITFYNTYTLLVYRKDFIYIDYWGAQSGVRTITLNKSDSYLLRCSIKKVNRATAYIKNNTTGEYIYKGSAVK